MPTCSGKRVAICLAPRPPSELNGGGKNRPLRLASGDISAPRVPLVAWKRDLGGPTLALSV